MQTSKSFVIIQILSLPVHYALQKLRKPVFPHHDVKVTNAPVAQCRLRKKLWQRRGQVPKLSRIRSLNTDRKLHCPFNLLVVRRASSFPSQNRSKSTFVRDRVTISQVIVCPKIMHQRMHDMARRPPLC